MYRDILSSASLQTNSLKNHKEGKFQLSPSEEIIWVKHYLCNLFFSKPSFQKDEYFSKTESQTNFNFLKLCKNECQTRFCEATSKEHYNEVFWLCHRNFTKKRLDLPEVETGRPWATAADSQQNICDINKRLRYMFSLVTKWNNFPKLNPKRNVKLGYRIFFNMCNPTQCQPIRNHSWTSPASKGT